MSDSNVVVVVDYGMGNLFSVRRALEVSGAANVSVTSDARDIAAAQRLVLPGVGAFQDGMRGLEERGLIDAVVDYAKSGRPLLGICLGMQMLASESEEFGTYRGLDLVPGRVVTIPHMLEGRTIRKLPFIGWAELSPEPENGFGGTCLKTVGLKDSVYLVHSFYFQPEEHSNLLAAYEYDGVQVTAAIRKENITGVQFHPEKSGRVGLRILESFLK